MKEPVFTGACPAIITPFDTTGVVNFDAFGKLIERQIAAGVDAICVCGTTGEASTLSTHEHARVIEYCVKTVDHRVKVIAGCGSNNTHSALYLSQHAQDVDADALLLVTPYYNKTSQTGLIKHYEFISDRVDIPIILYNVPSRTGISFTAKTYQTLSSNPKINGVKEASGNFTLIADTLYLCGDELNIWSGNDDQVVPMMSLGGKGVISVVCNILPELMVAISHACLHNNYDYARTLQIEHMDFIDSLFLEVNPIPVKYAMNLLHLDAGPLRLPLYDMSPHNSEILKAAMNRIGLLQ